MFQSASQTQEMVIIFEFVFKPEIIWESNSCPADITVKTLEQLTMMMPFNMNMVAKLTSLWIGSGVASRPDGHPNMTDFISHVPFVQRSKMEENAEPKHTGRNWSYKLN